MDEGGIGSERMLILCRYYLKKYRSLRQSYDKIE